MQMPSPISDNQLEYICEHFEYIKDAKEESKLFFKILSDLYNSIKQVSPHLKASFDQIGEDSQQQSAGKPQTLKQIKCILEASAHFSNLASEHQLVKAIQKTLRTWGKCLLGRGAPPSDCQPLAKKIRLIGPDDMLSHLPTEIILAICAHARWMAPLPLLSASKRLYTIYCENPSPFMAGIRLVNQTLTKLQKEIRGNLSSQIEFQYDVSCFQSLSIERVEFPLAVLFENVKRKIYQAIQQESLTTEDFGFYLYLLNNKCDGSRGFHLSQIYNIANMQASYISDLFHFIFPNAALTYKTPENFIFEFESCASKLTQENVSQAVDFRTGLLIAFLTQLPAIPADVYLLAWQTLIERADLATVPHKEDLLDALWSIGAEHFSHTHPLKSKMVARRANLAIVDGLPLKKNCTEILHLLDVNQALTLAYFSSVDDRLLILTAILERHREGAWQLELSQIKNILNSWSPKYTLADNEVYAYANRGIYNSYVCQYVSFAKSLLKILIDELKQSDVKLVQQLTDTICKHIRKTIDLDIDLHEDDDESDERGVYRLSGDFGCVLQLLDQIDTARSAAIFERLNAWLTHVIGAGRMLDVYQFIASILDWQSCQVYNLLNVTFQGNQEMQNSTIEIYAKHNPLEALELALAFSPSPKFLLELLNHRFPKHGDQISKEALSKGVEVMQWALTADSSLDPKSFLIYLAAFDFQCAWNLVLNFTDVDKRSACSLEMVTKNLSKCNHSSFYVDANTVECLTASTCPWNRATNAQVYNFLFKQTVNSLVDFEQLMCQAIAQQPADSVNSTFFAFHASTWGHIKSLYRALVRAGMPPQDLLLIIQRLANNVSMQESSWQTTLRGFLLEEGSTLMNKSIVNARVTGLLSS